MGNNKPTLIMNGPLAGWLALLACWACADVMASESNTTDRGIWPELNDRVEIHLPANFEPGKKDLDGDRIPNRVDVLRGARKTELNGAAYDGRYMRIPSRWGDVPRTIGVCTDVVVRSLRNAGLDLQSAVQRDYRRHPKRYPRIQSPNANIDHRRVKNLAPWFKHHWTPLPTDANFMPGDVVLMDTLPQAGPDHIGVVSDGTGPSGKALIINNWTYGSTTTSMDLLSFVTVTGHYRWPD